MELLRNKRLLALIGIICLVLGTMLPYFTFKLWCYTTSLSLWKYWEGKVILGLAIVNALFIFKDYIQKYAPQLFQSEVGKKIEQLNSKLSIVPVILVVLFIIILNARLDIASSYLKHGFGFYVLWIGIIALVLHVFLYKGQEKNEVYFSNIRKLPSFYLYVLLFPLLESSMRAFKGDGEDNYFFC